jgi:hypothetical protein
VVLPADRLPIPAGVRDLEQERLAPALGAGPHIRDHNIVIVFVDLVQERTVGPGTGLGAVGGDRSEEGAGRGVGQIPDRAPAGLLDPAREGGGLVHHRHGIPEQDLRLVQLRRSGVDLGSWFTISGEAVDPGTGSEGDLPLPLPISR